MKNAATVTEINVRAFCREFTLTIDKNGPKTLKQAIKHVEEDLEWDTAVVKSITRDGKTIINKMNQA